MQFRSALGWSVPALAAFALLNCTSASTHEPVPECDEIASLCHAAEDLSEDAASCHEQAHAGDVDVCLQIHDDCVALCEDLLGVGGAGGQGGAAH
jgi:hypothetical protein